MAKTLLERWQTDCGAVLDVFDAAAAKTPDSLFCRSGDTHLTYAQAAKAIAAFAQQLGPTAPRKTVALVLPNSAAFLVSFFGTLAAGAVPALVNYGHPDATVTKLLDGLDVTAVISDREIPGLEVTDFGDGHIEALLAAQAAPRSYRPKPEDIAAILFSGGTTGLPKQVPHSNAVLVSKIERMEWGWPTNDHEIWLPVAPFTHVYGFLMGVLNPVLRSGQIVIPPRFQPDLIVDMLREARVTIFGGGPPAIYQAIMASEKFATTKLPDLRVCPGGGAPFPIDVLRRWEKLTGLQITEGYGMTEIAPIAVNTESDGIKPGAAGKPVPDTVIEIVDIKTGAHVLPIGETGEIRVKGPHMMTGYAGNPEETAIAVRDGFVYTGDIGHLDTEGFLTISDRKKDVIFVKGFNVFPREIEEALLSHSAVSGACVVGRKDTRAGEVPVAYVVLRTAETTDTLLAYCKDTLTDYKVPARIVTLDALPLTPAGKVDRTALRQKTNEETP